MHNAGGLIQSISSHGIESQVDAAIEAVSSNYYLECGGLPYTVSCAVSLAVSVRAWPAYPSQPCYVLHTGV